MPIIVCRHLGKKLLHRNLSGRSIAKALYFSHRSEIAEHFFLMAERTHTYTCMYLLCASALSVSGFVVWAGYRMHRTSTFKVCRCNHIATCRCDFQPHFRTVRSCRRGPLEVLEHFLSWRNVQLTPTHVCTCRLSALVSLALLFARLYPMHRISTLPITLQFVQYSFRRHFRTV